jgi:hypothetical protein
VQALRGKGGPPQDGRAGQAGCYPDRRAGGQLVDHLGGDESGRRWVVAQVAEQGYREDRRRVVEPGQLPPDLSIEPAVKRGEPGPVLVSLAGVLLTCWWWELVTMAP